MKCLVYGTNANPKNHVFPLAGLGGGRDWILYLQYLSGIVYGFQKEDCAKPENPQAPVLHHRILSGLLPADEPDPR
jgi:hypothetical protein